MELYKEIKKDLSFVIFICGAILLFQAVFNIGLDDTDNADGTRSGMKLHTDYGTGIQYLSTGDGPLIPRLSSDGKTVMTTIETIE